MQNTANRNELIVKLHNEGDKVTLVHATSMQLAADYIATKVLIIPETENIKPHEVCILVRKDTEFSPQGLIVLEALKILV